MGLSINDVMLFLGALFNPLPVMLFYASFIVGLADPHPPHPLWHAVIYRRRLFYYNRKHILTAQLAAIKETYQCVKNIGWFIIMWAILMSFHVCKLNISLLSEE